MTLTLGTASWKNTGAIKGTKSLDGFFNIFVWVMILVGLVKSAGGLLYEYLRYGNDQDDDDKYDGSSCFADDHPGYDRIYKFIILACGYGYIVSEVRVTN